MNASYERSQKAYVQRGVPNMGMGDWDHSKGSQDKSEGSQEKN